MTASAETEITLRFGEAARTVEILPTQKAATRVGVLAVTYHEAYTDFDPWTFEIVDLPAHYEYQYTYWDAASRKFVAYNENTGEGFDADLTSYEFGGLYEGDMAVFIFADEALGGGWGFDCEYTDRGGAAGYHYYEIFRGDYFRELSVPVGLGGEKFVFEVIYHSGYLSWIDILAEMT